MPTPIPNAVAVVRASVYAALAPLTGTFSELPRCYWQIAVDLAPLPLLVIQSQDRGGFDASFLGRGGWQGLITVLAMAETDSGADAQLAGVFGAMEGMPHPSGYTIHSTFERPLTLAPADGVFYAGGIYRIRLYRV